jgi:hypothetical protein
MAVLTEFLFRLSFGLAVAMAATSARQVPAGFFRVHSHVLLGLNALAAMLALGEPDRFRWWPPVAAAVLSYIASVLWLYDRSRAGKLVLILIAAIALVGAYLAAPLRTGHPGLAAAILTWLDPVSGGLVVGAAIAAMLLGHWYLNTPGMQLAPLKRLLLLMIGAVILRSAVCGAGLALEIISTGPPDMAQMLFLSLRWLAGIAGTLVVAVMAWQTLKIPNTQSATGILYVGVIATFLGELTGQLLSARSVYPL